MKNLMVLFLFIYSIFFSLSALSQEQPIQWHSLSPQQTELVFRLPSYNIQEISCEDQIFSIIEAEHAQLMPLEGHPELPFWSTSVVIPRNSTVIIGEVSIGSSSFIEQISIFPTQNLQAQHPNLVMAEEIYQVHTSSEGTNTQFTNTNLIYPASNYHITEVQTVRDYQFITVNFYPFRFHALDQNLEITEEIRLVLNYNQGDNNSTIDNPYSLRPKISRSFEKLYESLFVNYEEIRLVNPIYQEPSLLIIYGGNANTNPIFDQYVVWRKQTGFLVNTAGVTTIGNSTTQIKNYIQNAYNTWENPPEYVLFVGNMRSSSSYLVPAYSLPEVSSSVYGDYPYSFLEGNDQLGDVFIGRLPAENLNQLTNLINKIFRYERQPFIAGEDWLNYSLLIGDWSSSSYSGSGISTVITNRNIKETIQNYDPQHLFKEVYGNGISPTTMVTEFNVGGVNFHYRGYYLMNGFSASNVNQVNNIDKLNNCVWITCGTAPWNDNSPCEAAVKRVTSTNAHAGAIMATGMSASATHTAYNNVLSSAIYNGLYHFNMPNMGMTNLYAKIYQQQAYSHQQNQAYYHSFFLSFFGDPTLSVYKSKPNSFNTNIPSTIPFGTQGLRLEVRDQFNASVADAWVTIRNSTGTYITKAYSNEQGIVILSLDPNQTGTLVCTISRPGYVPYLQEISFSTQPNVAVLGYTINTQNTNFVAQGENISLGLEIKNFTASSITNLTATISSESDYALITTNNTLLGTIGPEGIQTYNNAFNFLVSPLAVDQEILPLTITISSGTNSWISYLLPTIQGANLAITNTHYPNNLSYVNISDNSEIYFTLQNIGSQIINNISLKLKSKTVLYTVIDSVANLGTLNVGQSINHQNEKFRISISTETIPGMKLAGEILISNPQGFQQTIPINLIAGIKNTSDPNGPDDYGYIILDWNDSTIYEPPVYDWQEIKYIGTNIGMYDVDAISEEDSKHIPLPFTANYYGETYDQITICSNGWFSFGSTNVKEYRNLLLPTPIAPKGMVAVYWTDLVVGGSHGGGVYTYYDSSEHTFIVQWDEVKLVTSYPSHQTLATGSAVTFQAIIYDPAFYPTVLGDSPIKFQYKTFNAGVAGTSTGPFNYITIGMQDHTTDHGLTYVFNNVYRPGASSLGNNTALLLTQPPFLEGDLPSRGTLAGIVSYNSNPISNVLVKIIGLNRNVYTNTSGAFSIPFVPIGNYTLELSKYMYHQQTINNIVILPDETTNISPQIIPINHDLKAISLNGSNMINANTPSTYSINIFNEGHLSIYQMNYSIELRETDTDLVLVSVPGVAINSTETQTVTLVWTPTAMGSKKVYGYLNFSADEFPDNNATTSLQVDILPFGTVVKYMGDENSLLYGNQLPINYNNRNSLTQTIYHANSLNQYGVITKLIFFFNGFGDISTDSPPLRIYLGKTSAASFASGVNTWVPFNNFTLVYEGKLPVYEAGSYNVGIDLQTPFIYDADNLVLMIHRFNDNASPNNWNVSNSFRYTLEVSTAYRSIQAAADNNNAFNPEDFYPSGAALNRTPNTIFLINTGGIGNLTGIIQNSNAEPMAGVEVEILGMNRKATTDETGHYNFQILVEGNIEIKVNHFGYFPFFNNIEIEPNIDNVMNITLSPIPKVTINGQVLASDTWGGLSDATVSLVGYQDYQTTSWTDGRFSLMDVYGDNTYTITITHQGYQTYTNSNIQVGILPLMLEPMILTEKIDPPLNVFARPTAENLLLSWNSPSGNQQSWSGAKGMEIAEKNQLFSASKGLEIRQRFTPEQLITWGAANKEITNVAFYLHDEQNFAHTLKIYQGDIGSLELDENLLFSQQISPHELQPKQWNEIAILQPVPIPANTDIWIGIQVEENSDYLLGFSPQNEGLSNKNSFVLVDGRYLSINDVWGKEAGKWLIQVMSKPSLSEPNFLLLDNDVQAPMAQQSRMAFPRDQVLISKEDNNYQQSFFLPRLLSNRFVETYKVYRTLSSNMGTPALWETLTTDHNQTLFVDQTWKLQPDGFYRYALIAVYNNEQESAPAFSNEVEHFPASLVNITIYPEATYLPITETVVILSSNSVPGEIYTLRLTSNNFDFEVVRKGNYNLSINRDSYSTYLLNNLEINDDVVHLEANLMYFNAIFNTSFESIDFPPPGWLLNDADGDSYQWYRTETKANSGIASATSASWITTGALTPDNYLITPAINLNNYARASVRYAVSNNSPIFFREVYSILVSTSTNNLTDFVTVYTDTLTAQSVQWETKEVDLSSYTQNTVYLAFRHHSSTNLFQLFLDDVEIITGVNEVDNPFLKLHTSLVGNYPNPFNPSTTIVFDLAQESLVQIEIYNIKGQLVKTLLHETLTTGHHSVLWNGTDHNEKNVSTGLYFYQMKANNYTVVKKMLLMK